MAKTTPTRDTPAPPPKAVMVYLIVKNAPEAIAFYVRAFGAVELFRLTEPSGKIGHAELRFGSTVMMLADEYPDFGALAPPSIGGSPVKMHLAVEDADAAFARAKAAGAVELRPLTDEFYGERSGLLVDPFGHSWFVSQHIEDVSPEEMQRRFAAMLKT